MAERMIWFVSVVIEDIERTFPQRRQAYSLGPVESWTRAREIAQEWEIEHGAGTAEVEARSHQRSRREMMAAQ